MSNYVFLRGKHYYYRRRVPEFISDYDTRSVVKISLGTKDEKEAVRKAAIYNDYIEDYWRSLIKGAGKCDAESEYRTAVKLAKAHGFAYKNAVDVAKEPLEEIVNRLSVAGRGMESKDTVASILGGVQRPKFPLGDCLEQYWPLCADRLINKSDDQIRKWKNPRAAAMQSFVEVVGNKSLEEVERVDVLKFRTWWLGRIEKNEVVANTANKNLMFVKDILETVSISLEIDRDYDLIFSKTRLKEIGRSRPAFEASYVQDTLLNPMRLSGLNNEAKLLIYAMGRYGSARVRTGRFAGRRHILG